MIRFDMSDLIQKKKQFEKLQQQKVLELTQKLTLDVGRRLVEASPVDSGEFRGNWQIEPPSAPGQSGRVTNNTEYAAPLAKGHSPQAPEGWIENACEAAVRFGGEE